MLYVFKGASINETSNSLSVGISLLPTPKNNVFGVTGKLKKIVLSPSTIISLSAYLLLTLP
jgi:hypothetical protein